MTTGYQFLQQLTADWRDQWLELTFIHPADDPPTARIVTEWHATPIMRDLDWKRIARYNDLGYGCYYGVCPRLYAKARFQRGTENDSASIPGFWIDVDIPGNNGLEHIHNLPTPPPTYLIATGGGFHALWLACEPLALTSENREQVKLWIKQIAQLAGGDAACTDYARILRLPGTVNTKPKRGGAYCEIIETAPGGSWNNGTVSDLAARLIGAFGQTLAQPRQRVNWNTRAPLVPDPDDLAHRTNETPPRHADDDDLPGPLRWFYDNPPPEGERNRSLHWTACRLFDLGYTRSEIDNWLVAGATQIGLSEPEIERTIGSAQRTPRTPSNTATSLKSRMNNQVRES